MSDFDPFEAGLRDAKPAALFTPSAGAGKSSGGGLPRREEELAELAGAITSRDGVRIVRLAPSDFVGKFCGGLIGKAGNKACLVQNCDIQSHRLRRLEFPTTGEYLFIRGKDPDTVHTDPIIAPEALEPHLERYLAEKRSIAAWETLFRSLEQQPANECEPAEVEKLVKRIDEDKKDYGMTPLKKKARFQTNTASMEAGYPLKVKEMHGGLDPANPTFGAEFGLQWEAVIDNIRLLAKVTQAVRDHVLEVSQVTEDELDDQSYTMSKLSNLVGVRPIQMGTLTVFDAIRAASIEMDGLIEQLNPTKIVELEQYIKKNFQQTQSEFRNLILNQMTTSLNPIFQLFNSLSSDPKKPGDKLADEFHRIQEELNALQARLRNNSSHQQNGQKSQTFLVGPRRKQLQE